MRTPCSRASAPACSTCARRAFSRSSTARAFSCTRISAVPRSAPDVIAALSAIGSNYNNLEYSLDRRRARRARGVSRARARGAVRRRSRHRRQQQRRRAGADPAALLRGGGERGRHLARRAGADWRRLPDPGGSRVEWRPAARDRHDEPDVAQRLRPRHHAPDGARPESAPQQFFHGRLRGVAARPRTSRRWRGRSGSRSSRTSAAAR